MVSAGTQLPGCSQPPLGSGRSPGVFVCFPAGVYPGSITSHNGLASGILPPVHEVPSRHRPLDASTSSHHHLSPLPTAESTRDGYVQQVAPARDAGGGRRPARSVVVTDNANGQHLCSTYCVLHSVPNTCCAQFHWRLRAVHQVESIGTWTSDTPPRAFLLPGGGGRGRCCALPCTLDCRPRPPRETHSGFSLARTPCLVSRRATAHSRGAPLALSPASGHGSCGRCPACWGCPGAHHAGSGQGRAASSCIQCGSHCGH